MATADVVARLEPEPRLTMAEQAMRSRLPDTPSPREQEGRDYLHEYDKWRAEGVRQPELFEREVTHRG